MVKKLALVLIVVALSLAAIERQSLREHRARAFSQAAWDGSIWKMRVLELLGADPKDQAPGRGPAIIAAAETGKTAAIQYLLERGVDINQRDKFFDTAFTVASSEGHIDSVRFLIDKGANLNAISEDGSALRLALEHHHGVVVQLLKDHGARDCFFRGDSRVQCTPPDAFGLSSQ
jgi:Ankyrin repeats (3 copies)